jgi:putative flippase GtrA
VNLSDRITENSPLRFLLTGALNTILTFAIYVVLKTVVEYQVAYFASYVSGIIFSYFMNVLFVFKRRISLKTAMRFPFVYVVQYVSGALFLELLVRVLRLSATFAPLLVIFLTLPLTFFLSRLVFSKEGHRKSN